jgi:GT2 family glycosyltransferase
MGTSPHPAAWAAAPCRGVRGIEQFFGKVEALYREERLREAISGYFEILAAQPNHREARGRLASIASRLGRDDLAAEFGLGSSGRFKGGDADAARGALIDIDSTQRVARFATVSTDSRSGAWAATIAAYSELSSRAARQRPVAENISIAIPVFNTPVAYLHCCLDSVYRQTVRPRELIIADDCSTQPDTVRYLDALSHFTGLRVLRNKRNLSLGPTMNVALRAAQSNFVLKLDSDDIARPALVEAFDRYIREFPQADVVGCQMKMFGLSDAITGHPEIVTKRHVVSSPGYWFMNHTGVLLNKTRVLSVKGYRARRGLAEDYDLWIRMMLRGYNRFVNLRDTLVDYRVSGTSLSAKYSKFLRLQRAGLKLLARMAPKF